MFVKKSDSNHLYHKIRECALFPPIFCTENMNIRVKVTWYNIVNDVNNHINMLDMWKHVYCDLWTLFDIEKHRKLWVEPILVIKYYGG